MCDRDRAGFVMHFKVKHEPGPCLVCGQMIGTQGSPGWFTKREAYEARMFSGVVPCADIVCHSQSYGVE